MNIPQHSDPKVQAVFNALYDPTYTGVLRVKDKWCTIKDGMFMQGTRPTQEEAEKRLQE